MNIEDAVEWMIKAENDFDSAKILNESIRKYCEVICYLCAQAAEKYLKGYLIYQDIIPKKTHDLPFLNSLCIDKDGAFANLKTSFDFLNKFATDIRYPHKYEVTESDANLAISSVEKIRNSEPIISLRNTSDIESK